MHSICMPVYDFNRIGGVDESSVCEQPRLSPVEAMRANVRTVPRKGRSRIHIRAWLRRRSVKRTSARSLKAQRISEALDFVDS